MLIKLRGLETAQLAFTKERKNKISIKKRSWLRLNLQSRCSQEFKSDLIKIKLLKDLGNKLA